MEKEIDNLFLNETILTPEEEKIENLANCITRMKEITPVLKLIQEDLKLVESKYKVYDIQLESLATDLDTIQKQNDELEEKMERDQDIYDKLSNLVAALNIDDSHIQVLENGKFERTQDLIEMESALNILSGFKIDKFFIRLVKNMKDKIYNVQKDFYKRFVVFLNKVLVKSESQGQLRVHKELYASMRQYRFIFRYSKNTDKYFDSIYTAYTAHSREVYEKEFKNHLNSILNLIDDTGKLSSAIEIVIKSYESLILVETNFLKNFTLVGREIKIGSKQIFSGINEILLDFIDKMFKKSKLITILAISYYVTESVVDKPLLYQTFINELRQKHDVLQELYIKQEGDKITDIFNSDNKAKLSALNHLFIQKDVFALQKKILSILIKKIEDNLSKMELKILIRVNQTIKSLKLNIDLKEYISETISDIDNELKNSATQFILQEENTEEQIKKVVKFIDFSEMESGIEIMKIIRGSILETVDTKEKEEIIKLFSQLNLKENK
ncbi:hypothetical protein A0H76_1044 [Hepatospora eriocheir]|uniref:Exocyst complex component Sec3 coiled-coil domain-containing protein n=1 Tax=Hepatospora eriocheir TaxID=1081669 RepID=A0A1X0QHR4_9MICR|nr:hypothetical protein A0H76_1044 [Hepatospora eriocheir]